MHSPAAQKIEFQVVLPFIQVALRRWILEFRVVLPFLQASVTPLNISEGFSPCGISKDSFSGRSSPAALRDPPIPFLLLLERHPGASVGDIDAHSAFLRPSMREVNTELRFRGRKLPNLHRSAHQVLGRVISSRRTRVL